MRVSTSQGGPGHPEVARGGWQHLLGTSNVSLACYKQSPPKPLLASTNSCANQPIPCASQPVPCPVNHQPSSPPSHDRCAHKPPILAQTHAFCCLWTIGGKTVHPFVRHLGLIRPAFGYHLGRLIPYTTTTYTHQHHKTQTAQSPDFLSPTTPKCQTHPHPLPYLLTQ